MGNFFYKKNNEEQYFYNKNYFNLTKKYIDTNNKRPSSDDKNKEIATIGKFILRQMNSYNGKGDTLDDRTKYDIWKKFIESEKYKIYFESFEEKWYRIFNSLKKYMDNNNTIPSYKEDKELYKWMNHQKENYKKKKDLMKLDNIYNSWKTEILENNKYNNLIKKGRR